VASWSRFPIDDATIHPSTLPQDLVADDPVDLDELELRADPHAYSDLTELEYFAVSWRYGLDGSPHSMKELAGELGCNHAEAREVLGRALDKLRHRLLTD
jgi:DNA-directed RNA polymerase sigma subunit (sigma70/sigma32)